MSKWENRKLGDIGDGYIGLTYAPVDVSEIGTIVLRSGNIQDNKLDFSDVIRVSKKISEKLKVKNGDILICSRNGSANLVGKSALIDNLNEEMTFGAFMMIYKSDYNLFLIHYFHSHYFRRQLNKSATTTINQITKKMLDEIEVPFPPLETQKQITKTLDTTAELLIMRKKQLGELDNLIKSIFYDMFGDPVTNEKGWEVKYLDQIGAWASGGTPSRTKPIYFVGNIDWYSAGELNQLFLPPSIEKITKQAIQDSSAKLFDANSLLIGMYDTAAFKMGILNKPSSSNQACANVKPNETVEIIWLYHNLQNMKEYFLLNRRGIRQKNLNLGMIKKFEIPIPPTALQTKFVEIVTKIEEQKTLVKKAINETQYLFDSLMSEYFE